MTICKHKNKTKAGLEYRSDGVHQRYRCKDCGKIIIAELVRKYGE